MFSPEKIIHSFISNNKKKLLIGLSWQKIFREFFFILYFQNHLLKHYFHPCNITICLNKNISIDEIMNNLNINAGVEE